MRAKINLGPVMGGWASRVHSSRAKKLAAENFVGLSGRLRNEANIFTKKTRNS